MFTSAWITEASASSIRESAHRRRGIVRLENENHAGRRVRGMNALRPELGPAWLLAESVTDVKQQQDPGDRQCPFETFIRVHTL